MLRNSLLMIPAIALAGSFAAGVASARPLTGVEQPSMFLDDDDDHDNHDVKLEFCLELQVSIDDGACHSDSGPSCIDSCAQAAAETCGTQLGARAFDSCTSRVTRSCERSCANTVGALCSTRWIDDDDDDDHDHDDSDVFIELQFCFEIEIDN